MPSPCYRLFAVVVHIGSHIASGHYVCLVRGAKTGRWVRVDDDTIEVWNVLER